MPDQACATCGLLAGSTCRITGLARGPTDTCGLTDAQRRDLLRQSRAIVAGLGEAKKVVVNSISPCSGGGHLLFDLTVDGQPIVRVIGRDALVAVAEELDPVERLVAVMSELVQASGATTPAEVRGLLEGSTWYYGGGQ